jgi:hypothetical protein
VLACVQVAAAKGAAKQQPVPQEASEQQLADAIRMAVEQLLASQPAGLVAAQPSPPPPTDTNTGGTDSGGGVVKQVGAAAAEVAAVARLEQVGVAAACCCCRAHAPAY